MPDIQWMNLDPVKLMEELGQYTSLEGFKEMLDKAQVRHYWRVTYWRVDLLVYLETALNMGSVAHCSG